MIDLLYNLFLAVTGVVAVSCTVFYFLLKKRYQYWKDLGVPGPEPKMLVGNTIELVKLQMTDAELTDVFYQQYPKEKYIGFYNLFKPMLLVRDLDLLKKIMEKDFDYFADRPGMEPHVTSDSIMINLFSQTGDVWKSRRAGFTKLFTPKKLKDYLDDMQSSLVYLMKDFEAKVDQDLELVPVVRKHAIRTICMQLYGVDVSKDEERIQKFCQSADVFSRPTASLVLKALVNNMVPTICKLLNLAIFPAHLYEYFADFTQELFSTRQKDNSTRNDLLETIMKMRAEGTGTEKMGFEEAVGHIYTFFQASFDTTELTISHAFLQLAMHPEVQEKAREEVESVLKGSQTIDYDLLSQMNYLDAIICETLRRYPSVGVLDRTCTKDYKLNERLTIPKGTIVHIPVASVQMDPAHYPEPEKFIPERFYNKEDSNKDAWLPFGLGPRICIGLRLAKITVKLVLARTLSEYLIVPSDKMVLPMRFDPKTIVFSVRPADGFYVKLKKRKQTSR